MDAPISLEAKIDQLFGLLMMQVQEHLAKHASEAELSVNQAVALRGLCSAVPMRHLASHMGCDASYVTGIADGLEKRGLIERQAHPKDRRIKQLALTKEGKKVRAALNQAVLEGHPLLEGLSQKERETFKDLLAKITQSNC